MIIAGIHRSGTSLVTQWLHQCGLNVGDELLGAGTGNENGHFEDLAFLNSHKALLTVRRLSDNGFTDSVLKPLSFEEKDKLKDIISFKNSYYAQWGWKDPRTCLFLDVYHELIPGAFYFVVIRNAVPVVSSLINRMYKQSEQKYNGRKGLGTFIWKHFIRHKKMEMLRKKYSQRLLKIWIHYNNIILQHVKQLPATQYLVGDYTIGFNHQQLVLNRLEEMGFVLQPVNFLSIYKPEQISQSFDIAPYIKNKSLLSKAVAIEDALRQLAIGTNKV